MKKLLLTALCAILGVCAYAQKGSNTIGVNILYNTQVTESAGLGIKAQHFFTNNFRGEASFNYFFQNDKVSMFDFNANVHYRVNLSKDFHIYPLIGLTIGHYMFDFDEVDSKTRIGGNFGGGLEYDIDSKLTIGFEGKYQLVDDFDQGVISIGLTYRF